ncbi:MAG: hypothetical protein K0S32_333 [Bacteroidetes bacterium]|nr:hypothetical protein [Bacteroidota bacterium]
MKTIIIIAVSLLCLSASSQVDKPGPTDKSSAFYCAKLKDGMMVLVNEGKEVITDVVLANGGKITSDCTLIKPDGTSVKLQNEECVSPEGNVVKPIRKEKQNGSR